MCFFFVWLGRKCEREKGKEIGKGKLVRLFVIDESGVAE